MRKLIRINIAATLLLAGLFFGINKLFAVDAIYCPWLTETPETPVRVKHKTCCSRYYECDAFGVVHDEPCPPGTLYNVDLQACDHPENVYCDSEPDWCINGNGGAIALRNCYTAFSNTINPQGYFLECGNTSNDPNLIFSCQDLNPFLPAWGITLISKCYESIAM